MNHIAKQEAEVSEKWQKYELLADLGLASRHYLTENIHRFTWNERWAVIRQLESMMDELGELRFCVVKLVTRKLSFLLPNYRIYTMEDIEGLRHAIQEPVHRYDEIWFCKTIIDPSQFSVAGRIVIDRRAGDAAQTIEQVWRCSPRLIETIGDNFRFPYIRAIRPGWGWRPRIQGSILPQDSGLSESALCSELGRTLHLMYPHRERIAEFEDFLFDCGCDAISLEYKVEGMTLRFIDWDTHQDRQVLRCWKEKCR